MNNYKDNKDFKRLIDNIIFYSNYSFFNTLLIDYQYPNFLDLSTKNNYEKEGFEVNNNATTINILSPENEEYISMTENNKEIIKNINDLTKDEFKQYRDPDNKNILFYHKNFKGLNIIDLYDCKDTNMKLEDYKHYDLPILFYTDINDIYNSFVKAIYSSGYKVKYCEMNPKFSFDEETNTINIKNGLNNNIKIKAMLDVYTSLNSSNNFEKGLLNYAICKGIGIDDDFMDKNDLTEWYKKTNIKDVDKTLKLLSSKGKKFIDKFNKFYELESKNYEYENVSLYDDFKISI